MIDSGVPIRISLWLGTGTVVVVLVSRFCITMWLHVAATPANLCESVLSEDSANLCFLEVLSRFHDGVALAGDVQLGAQADVSIPFALNSRSKLLFVLHLFPVGHTVRIANSVAGSV